MSKALVKYKGKAAGILEETDEGYEFRRSQLIVLPSPIFC